MLLRCLMKCLREVGFDIYVGLMMLDVRQIIECLLMYCKNEKKPTWFIFIGWCKIIVLHTIRLKFLLKDNMVQFYSLIFNYNN